MEAEVPASFFFFLLFWTGSVICRSRRRLLKVEPIVSNAAKIFMSLLRSENLYDNRRAAAEREQTSTISIYRKKKVDTKAVLMGLEAFQESNLRSLHPLVENLTPIFPHQQTYSKAFALFFFSPHK